MRPEKFHWRLPWYVAVEKGSGALIFNANKQSIMDSEIVCIPRRAFLSSLTILTVSGPKTKISTNATGTGAKRKADSVHLAVDTRLKIRLMDLDLHEVIP